MMESVAPAADSPAPSVGSAAGSSVEPSPISVPPLVVKVTGVSLGIARWDAFDGANGVVDLVPTYRFHAHVDGGDPYDIEVLALDPAGFDFSTPKPIPVPAGSPIPAPSK